MHRTPAVLAALALLASACQADDTAGTLDDGPVEVTPGQGESPTADPDGTASGDDDGSGANGNAGDVIDVRSQHPVTAGPGRWAIGDAGFVEFDLADSGLVLLDVTEADGWSSRVDEESDDEVEVDFERDNVDIEVEIELDDGVVEIDINTDIEPAETGTYELGRAGPVEYALDGGRLSLRDVVANEGWDLRLDEDSSEEIEFSLHSGNERWRVEIELDDGVVELEVDYRVRDSV